jgi:hypothetical protein
MLDAVSALIIIFLVLVLKPVTAFAGSGFFMLVLKYNCRFGFSLDGSWGYLQKGIV